MATYSSHYRQHNYPPAQPASAVLASTTSNYQLYQQYLHQQQQQQQPPVYITNNNTTGLLMAYVNGGGAATGTSNGSDHRSITPPPEQRNPMAQFDAVEDLVNSSEFAEYGLEIAEFMKSLEEVTAANATYMDEQPEVTWKMRKTLILWLIEVHTEYDLRQETLYLCVNILDRFCSQRKVPRSQYQLLGVTSLWIAAKYEENHGRVPTLKQLFQICCHSYPDKDFIQMELVVLGELNFVLGHPTAETFVKANCRFMSCVEPSSRALARYLLEFTLIDSRFLLYRPSVLATASILLADLIRNNLNWVYNDPNLVACMSMLVEMLGEPPRELFKKFSSNKFLRAALVARHWIENGSPNRHCIANPQPSGLSTPPKDGLLQRWMMDLPITPTSPIITPSLVYIDSSQHQQHYASRYAMGNPPALSSSSSSTCSTNSSSSSSSASSSASYDSRLPPYRPPVLPNDHQLCDPFPNRSL